MTAPVAASIRILILDDHALFREGLMRLLQSEPDFTVVGCYETVSEAIAALSRTPADVILLDYDLGNRKGSEFLAHASKAGLRCRTLVLTAGLANLEAKRMIGLGAAGIFLKHDPLELLSKSIREVFAGRSWFNQDLLRELIDGASSRRTNRFTDRERQVLRGVVEGLSNKEIAARSSISESAVKAVLQQLFNKMGLRTRTQLVRAALEEYRGEY